MRFAHEDAEFPDLLRIVGRDTGLSPALVEKDYWVTHAMWALHQTGLEIWLKGGTSLSKGFGLIRRFSEDLDLWIEPGKAVGVPSVTNWKSGNKGPVAARRAFFEALESAMTVPGAKVCLDLALLDKDARGAAFRVMYPGRFLDGLAPAMRPFVLLEVGNARVTPFLERPLDSFVHRWLETGKQAGSYRDNLPRAVRCVHPVVTLVEKLDAISRRHARPGMEPAAFIRHYEDAARIIAALPDLPPLGQDVPGLTAEMLSQRQIAQAPRADDPAFTLADGERRRAVEQAHQAIAPMFWGDRLTLAACCEAIRGWISKTIE